MTVYDHWEQGVIQYSRFLFTTKCRQTDTQQNVVLRRLTDSKKSLVESKYRTWTETTLIRPNCQFRSVNWYYTEIPVESYFLDLDLVRNSKDHYSTKRVCHHHQTLDLCFVQNKLGRCLPVSLNLFFRGL